MKKSIRQRLLTAFIFYLSLVITITPLYPVFAYQQGRLLAQEDGGGDGGGGYSGPYSGPSDDGGGSGGDNGSGGGGGGSVDTSGGYDYPSPYGGDEGGGGSVDNSGVDNGGASSSAPPEESTPPESVDTSGSTISVAQTDDPGVPQEPDPASATTEPSPTDTSTQPPADCTTDCANLAPGSEPVTSPEPSINPDENTTIPPNNTPPSQDIADTESSQLASAGNGQATDQQPTQTYQPDQNPNYDPSSQDQNLNQYLSDANQAAIDYANSLSAERQAVDQGNSPEQIATTQQVPEPSSAAPAPAEANPTASSPEAPEAQVSEPEPSDNGGGVDNSGGITGSAVTRAGVITQQTPIDTSNTPAVTIVHGGDTSNNPVTGIQGFFGGLLSRGQSEEQSLVDQINSSKNDLQSNIAQQIDSLSPQQKLQETAQSLGLPSYIDPSQALDKVKSLTDSIGLQFQGDPNNFTLSAPIEGCDAMSGFCGNVDQANAIVGPAGAVAGAVGNLVTAGIVDDQKTLIEADQVFQNNKDKIESLAAVAGVPPPQNDPQDSHLNFLVSVEGGVVPDVNNDSYYRFLKLQDSLAADEQSRPDGSLSVDQLKARQELEKTIDQVNQKSQEAVDKFENSASLGTKGLVGEVTGADQYRSDHADELQQAWQAAGLTSTGLDGDVKGVNSFNHLALAVDCISDCGAPLVDQNQNLNKVELLREALAQDKLDRPNLSPDQQQARQKAEDILNNINAKAVDATRDVAIAAGMTIVGGVPGAEALAERNAAEQAAKDAAAQALKDENPLTRFISSFTHEGGDTPTFTSSLTHEAGTTAETAASREAAQEVESVAQVVAGKAEAGEVLTKGDVDALHAAETDGASKELADDLKAETEGGKIPDSQTLANDAKKIEDEAVLTAANSEEGIAKAKIDRLVKFIDEHTDGFKNPLSNQDILAARALDASPITQEYLDRVALKSKGFKDVTKEAADGAAQAAEQDAAAAAAAEAKAQAEASLDQTFAEAKAQTAGFTKAPNAEGIQAVEATATRPEIKALVDQIEASTNGFKDIPKSQDVAAAVQKVEGQAAPAAQPVSSSVPEVLNPVAQVVTKVEDTISQIGRAPSELSSQDQTVLNQFMKENGLSRDTVVYRVTDPQYVDVTSGIAKANDASVATVRDIYNTGPHPLDSRLQFTPPEKSSNLGPSLNVMAGDPTLYADPGAVKIGIKLGDILDQGGKIYPDDTAVLNGIGKKPLIVTLPEGRVPVQSIADVGSGKTLYTAKPSGPEGFIGGLGERIAGAFSRVEDLVGVKGPCGAFEFSIIKKTYAAGPCTLPAPNAATVSEVGKSPLLVEAAGGKEAYYSAVNLDKVGQLAEGQKLDSVVGIHQRDGSISWKRAEIDYKGNITDIPDANPLSDQQIRELNQSVNNSYKTHEIYSPSEGEGSFAEKVHGIDQRVAAADQTGFTTENGNIIASSAVEVLNSGPNKTIMAKMITKDGKSLTVAKIQQQAVGADGKYITDKYLPGAWGVYDDTSIGLVDTHNINFTENSKLTVKDKAELDRRFITNQDSASVKTFDFLNRDGSLNPEVKNTTELKKLLDSTTPKIAPCSIGDNFEFSIIKKAYAVGPCSAPQNQNLIAKVVSKLKSAFKPSKGGSAVSQGTKIAPQTAKTNSVLSRVGQAKDSLIETSTTQGSVGNNVLTTLSSDIGGPLTQAELGLFESTPVGSKFLSAFTHEGGADLTSVSSFTHEGGFSSSVITTTLDKTPPVVVEQTPLPAVDFHTGPAKVDLFADDRQVTIKAVEQADGLLPPTSNFNQETLTKAQGISSKIFSGVADPEGESELKIAAKWVNHEGELTLAKQKVDSALEYLRNWRDVITNQKYQEPTRFITDSTGVTRDSIQDYNDLRERLTQQTGAKWIGKDPNTISQIYPHLIDAEVTYQTDQAALRPVLEQTQQTITIIAQNIQKEGVVPLDKLSKVDIASDLNSSKTFIAPHSVVDDESKGVVGLYWSGLDVVQLDRNYEQGLGFSTVCHEFCHRMQYLESEKRYADVLANGQTPISFDNYLDLAFNAQGVEAQQRPELVRRLTEGVTENFSQNGLVVSGKQKDLLYKIGQGSYPGEVRMINEGIIPAIMKNKGYSYDQANSVVLYTGLTGDYATLVDAAGGSKVVTEIVQNAKVGSSISNVVRTTNARLDSSPLSVQISSFAVSAGFWTGVGTFTYKSLQNDQVHIPFTPFYIPSIKNLLSRIPAFPAITIPNPFYKESFNLVSTAFAQGNNPTGAILDAKQANLALQKEYIKQKLLADGKVDSNFIKEVLSTNFLQQEAYPTSSGYSFTTGDSGFAQTSVDSGSYIVKVDPVAGLDITVPQNAKIQGGGEFIVPIIVKAGSGQVTYTKVQPNLLQSLGNIIPKAHAAEPAKASSSKVTVAVIDDKNGNGSLDKGEKLTPMAGVSVSLDKTSQDKIISLHAGWNLISLPILPNQPLTASILLSQIAKEGGYATTISSLQDNQWQSYIIRGDKSFSGSNFTIEPAKAYFVKVIKPAVITLSGQDFISSVGLDLKSGWNGIGVPFSANQYDASKLLDELNKSGKADELSEFDSGVWNTLLRKGQQQFGGSFKINNKKGYILKTEDNFKFSP